MIWLKTKSRFNVGRRWNCV